MQKQQCLHGGRRAGERKCHTKARPRIITHCGHDEVNMSGEGMAANGARKYMVFCSDGDDSHEAGIEGDWRSWIWRPSLLHLCPQTAPRKSVLWSLAHFAGVLHTREYAVLLLAYQDRVVHRSSVIPACFRWPFMCDGDLQISSTWTDPEFRGRGLATSAVRRLFALFAEPGRHFWYVTRAENRASLAVCVKTGFWFVGNARRTRRLGSRLLGSFELIEKAMDNTKAKKIA
jgi:hypothetical protein